MLTKNVQTEMKIGLFVRYNYNLSPGIATPMGPTSRRRLEFIALRYLQDYMLVTHLAIPLKEAL